MPTSARKSPEIDKEGKAFEAQSQKTGRTSSAQIHQPLCRQSIQACPALRAPRLDPRVLPRAEPHQKLTAGKDATTPLTLILQALSYELTG
jgi:hypothetical protein